MNIRILTYNASVVILSLPIRIHVHQLIHSQFMQTVNNSPTWRSLSSKDRSNDLLGHLHRLNLRKQMMPAVRQFFISILESWGEFDIRAMRILNSRALEEILSSSTKFPSGFMMVSTSGLNVEDTQVTYSVSHSNCGASVRPQWRSW